MSKNLGYLQSQLNIRKSSQPKDSTNTKASNRPKDDFVKANKVFAYKHELDKQERRDRIRSRRGDDFVLTEAQDEARKQKMREGIDRYNALKSNKAKPTADERSLLEFENNYSSDSSDYNSDDNDADELTEAEDDLGRTVTITRREKEMMNPLSQRSFRVKGDVIYGDKLGSDWNVYEQTPEEIERFKAHYADKGYVRDPTKDQDQRHKGASYYKFGDESIKQQQIDDLKARHLDTLANREKPSYSYRKARMMLVKEHQPTRSTFESQANSLINEAINTS
ncbi:hypothetical protein E3P99_03588 [Wallemia hederae]|uniref:Uncharacterized protein n=1 Tax=Wallemia hederae TaxID=1540922 RepID=A0A4T0FFH8_9BASI|nr:hypothetical protein E3P99_03588 [Wallemia hederae]